MISPRWRKVLKDLWSNKARTLLVVASIAVGIFAAGITITAYVVVAEDMDTDFRSANPHSSMIFMMPFDDDFVSVVREIPGVGAAEGRLEYSAQVFTPKNTWANVNMTALPLDWQIGTAEMIDGSPLPKLKDNEILIEQTGLTVMPLKAGDTIDLKLSETRFRKFRVAGIVHSPTTFSSIFTGSINAFINMSAMENLTGSRQYSTLLVRVAENERDEQHVKAVTALVSKKAEKSGRLVFATVVQRPGYHPISSIVQSLMILEGGLGLLAIFLSAFLVINTISALLSQHTRQIGVMKSVGATSRQIVGMYVVLVFCFGLLAFIFAVPVSAVAGYLFNNFMGSMMNYKASPLAVPMPALLAQAVVAFVIPIGAALVPVIKGAGQTVREAISNYGVGAGTFGRGFFDRIIESFRGLPRPLLISLRNTFRRKSRLIMTLSTLTLGGAIFIAVFNVQASFDVVMDKVLGYFLSDITLQLNDFNRIEYVSDIIREVPGVNKVEPWAVMPAKILSADKETATEIMMWGPPGDSTLIQPVVVEGRWILPEDENALVIGNHVLQSIPDLKVGDEVVLLINNKEHKFKIVGIFLMAGNVIPPFTYANYDYLTKLMNTPGQAAYYLVDLNIDGPAAEKQAADQIRALLTSTGIGVGSISTGTEDRAQQQVGTNILVYFLMFMAVLIAIVGGLGLSGTMSMNVMERTREIGVMRSIGARNVSIIGIVVFEGTLIGLISWLLGTLLAYPISYLLCTAVGVAFLTVPMEAVISPVGIIAWAVLVAILSAVASLLPALNAARLTIRDVLAYE